MNRIVLMRRTYKLLIIKNFTAHYMTLKMGWTPGEIVPLLPLYMACFPVYPMFLRLLIRQLSHFEEEARYQ